MFDIDAAMEAFQKGRVGDWLRRRGDRRYVSQVLDDVQRQRLNAEFRRIEAMADHKHLMEEWAEEGARKKAVDQEEHPEWFDGQEPGVHHLYSDDIYSPDTPRVTATVDGQPFDKVVRSKRSEEMPRIPEEEPDEIDYASQVTYLDSRDDPKPKRPVPQAVSSGIRPTIEEAIDAFNNHRDIRTDPYAYESDYVNDPNDELHKEYDRLFNFATKVGYNQVRFPKGRTASEIRHGLDKLDHDIHWWLANRG